MFLDAMPSSSLLDLAERLEVAVVAEQDGRYVLASRKANNALRSLFLEEWVAASSPAEPACSTST
tara:strand:+ start:122 stop:316 length:195 start_codon:yes stop_codon:yes gene_type:complete